MGGGGWGGAGKDGKHTVKNEKQICISRAHSHTSRRGKEESNSVSLTNKSRKRAHSKSAHEKARTPTTSVVLQRGSEGRQHMFFTGGGALRFHKVGNPELLPVTAESCTAEQQLRDLPEGTKCRTLLVSMAARVVANAHFLSPTTSTPPSQPIMVVLSRAAECEITSALWLRSVSDCLSDTCSDSAPLSPPPPPLPRRAAGS